MFLLIGEFQSVLRAVEVDLEPGDGTRSPGDGADSDTPVYRTFSEQFQSSFKNSIQ